MSLTLTFDFFDMFLTFVAWHWCGFVYCGTRCGQSCSRLLKQFDCRNGLLDTSKHNVLALYHLIMRRVLVPLTYANASYTDIYTCNYFQANTEDELPESLLGTCRLNHMDTAKAVSAESIKNTWGQTREHVDFLVD